MLTILFFVILGDFKANKIQYRNVFLSISVKRQSLTSTLCYGREARQGERPQVQTQTETEAQTDVKTVLYLQSETKP